MVVLHFDQISMTHEESVFKAFSNIALDDVVYANVNITYKEGFEEEVFKAAKQLIDKSDVINWSFSNLKYTPDYTYDGVIKDGFLENTAFTIAAGNGGSGTFRQDIGELQSSPYDFTVGAIKTFEWDPNTPYGDRAAKIAKFDLADFSETAPKFVDFYTYGDGGTSFAAPHVAALIAKIKQDHPEYTLNQIRTVLERNSKHIEFTKTGNTFVAQVLDPFDLENNEIRDGKPGATINLFTDGITREDYTFAFNTEHKIDAWTKLDGLYEIIFNRNHDEPGLTSWLGKVGSGMSVAQVINNFSNEANTINGGVALIERIQALYHVGLSREPTPEETVVAIDYYASNNEDFGKVISTFVGLYNIELNNLGWN